MVSTSGKECYKLLFKINSNKISFENVSSATTNLRQAVAASEAAPLSLRSAPRGAVHAASRGPRGAGAGAGRRAVGHRSGAAPAADVIQVPMLFVHISAASILLYKLLYRLVLGRYEYLPNLMLN